MFDSKYKNIIPSAAAGFAGNIVAIPFSVVFVEAAIMSVNNQKPLAIKEVFELHKTMMQQILTNPCYVYRGGIARTFQKVTTAVSGRLWAEKHKLPEHLSSNEKFFYTVFSAGFGGFLASPIPITLQVANSGECRI